MIFQAKNWWGEVLEIEIREGRYHRIETQPGEADASLPLIAPGLIDLQINGFAGIDFNRAIASDADWQQATQKLYDHGCTGFLIALITNTEEETRRLLTDLTARLKTNPRNCLGFHLEGPWLNPDPGTRGAHNPDWMQKPSLRLLEEWQAIAGDYLKLITLAPEVEISASEEVIRAGTGKGIKFFIGHSLAMGDILDRAIQAGVIGWTHLGNAAPSPAAKFENVIFHALARPDLYASLIPDGVHLPPHAFQVLAQALGDRLLLTTDAMAGAIAPPGIYSLGQTEVEVAEDGSARLPGSGRLAGSTLAPIRGVFRTTYMTSIGSQKAWKAFSQRPAKLLGLAHGVEEGNSADFCLLAQGDKPLLATYHRGECVSRLT